MWWPLCVAKALRFYGANIGCISPRRGEAAVRKQRAP